MPIMIHHFSDIRPGQFLKLPNFVLEKLFQSPQLQVDDEDFLFNLVVDLIGRDPSRKTLLKSIYFPGVSSFRLINFFTNFPPEEIDSDLFESLKTRLFCEVYLPNSIPPSRWRNSLTPRSKEEIESIFQFLQEHFHRTTNPVQLIQSVINEKEKMKKILEEMKTKTQNEFNQFKILKTFLKSIG
jgi:hypothetical protein